MTPFGLRIDLDVVQQQLADVLGEATVWSVTGEAAADGGTSDRVWVALLVSEDLQAAVAQSAADGRLRLSLLGS